MCGILGYFGSFDPSALKEGLCRTAHRGPDDSGTFFDDNAGVGLGHRRLSILDLSPLGHQPMATSDGAVTIIFNGEIYNFPELRKELEAKGHVFKSRSDTEALLYLYQDEGEAMLRRLNGIFAFAIWDARQRSLLIARDALGVKPLYYAATSNGVVFGSEIKGMLPLLPEARTLDAIALHRYMMFLWCPGEGTPLKEVRKLLPGQAMVVREGKIQRHWTWYELPVFRTHGPEVNEQEALAGTVEHVRQAVHLQMLSDVPVGAFLSGGLDSSAIVAFARELTPDIRCFTIESVGDGEDGFISDLPYAKRVAKHLNVPLDVVRIDPHRMAGDIEMLVTQLDEPLADPAPLNVLYISQLARQNGMKVLLSGAGGDDLFTGYRRHVAAAYEGMWSWLPGGVRRGLERATTGLDQRSAFKRRASRLLRGAGLNGDERVANYFAWASEPELLDLYTPDFREELGGAHAVDPMLDFLAPLPSSVGALDRMLALDQRFFLADHNLIYTDKMSMATSVEVRVPFLDLDLVEFAARIPAGIKQRGRVSKWVLKKAMEPYLPHDVIYRPKTGFGAPLRRWMRGDLLPWITTVLSAESLNKRGIFDARRVHRMIEDNAAGRVDASYTLLSMLSIEIWCRTYLDQRAPVAQRS